MNHMVTAVPESNCCGTFQWTVDQGICDLSVQVMPSCSNFTIHTDICFKSAR